MGRRRKAREVALQFLYQLDLRGESDPRPAADEFWARHPADADTRAFADELPGLLALAAHPSPSSSAAAPEDSAASASARPSASGAATSPVRRTRTMRPPLFAPTMPSIASRPFTTRA